ncbi:hypothetical protein L6452_04598 [Arctium lappa]|uniref:Uncharacterized protein n=1 Tax=Arctium lappa TaxID=4217 RepID=A0ACB9EDZ4_ARCLA|nr:hypothetical protein L6452_04598 [Arctium lappa]
MTVVAMLENARIGLLSKSKIIKRQTLDFPPLPHFIKREIQSPNFHFSIFNRTSWYTNNSVKREKLRKVERNTLVEILK